MLALGVLLVAGCRAPARSAASPPSDLMDSQDGYMAFQDAPVQSVLVIYEDISGCQVIESSDVKWHYGPVTIRSEAPLSRARAMKVIERAVLEQTGIVITPLDSQRVSVTFNDRLPIVAATPQP